MFYISLENIFKSWGWSTSMCEIYYKIEKKIGEANMVKY